MSGRPRMLGRLLAGSLRRRWRHLAVATAAVTLGAAMVGAAATVGSSVREWTDRSMRAYGPNLMLVPRSGVGAGTTLDAHDLDSLERARSSGKLTGYAPFLYAIGRIGGQPVAVAGTWFDEARSLSPWWRVRGSWVRDGDQGAALIGANVAESFGLGVGDELTVGYGNLAGHFRVAGVVSTGGPEDGQVLVALAAAQRLSGRAGRVSLVQARAASSELPAAASAIRSGAPDGEVKTVLQVASAERNVGGRIELLLGLVGLIVLATAGLGVVATQTTSVLERSGEVALMKALGASERRIGEIFFAEGLVVGAAGGVLGAGLGGLFAVTIGRTVFAAPVSPRLWEIPVTVVAAILVTLLASLPPIHRAASSEPAAVLRGE